MLGQRARMPSTSGTVRCRVVQLDRLREASAVAAPTAAGRCANAFCRAHSEVSPVGGEGSGCEGVWGEGRRAEAEPGADTQQAAVMGQRLAVPGSAAHRSPDSLGTAGMSVRPHSSRARRRRPGGRQASHSAGTARCAAVVQRRLSDVRAVADARAAGRRGRPGSLRVRASSPAEQRHKWAAVG